MRALRKALKQHGSSQVALARELGISEASVSLMVNHGRLPKGCDRATLVARIRAHLVALGATQAQAVGATRIARGATRATTRTQNEVPAGSRSNATPQAAVRADEHAAAHSGPRPVNPEAESEDTPMLLKKHVLSALARQHFKITRDPFNEELATAEDVFRSEDIRYVQAAMRSTARHGGMLAVIGESGAGKSTLLQDLQEWINTTGEPITPIVPYVLNTSEGKARGERTLRADDIVRSVFRTLAPLAAVPQLNDARADRLHKLLAESARLGRRHVVVIEEAHDLAKPTLKSLKRFYELQDGFKKLLAVILVGQTELEAKLSENDPTVREVVQRIEIVHLPALDNNVEGYVRHKLQRAGLDPESVLAPDAADEIRSRLRQSVTDSQRGQRVTRTVSLCHPLAINNLVTAAINKAASIGAPKVNAALIAAAAGGQ